MSKYGLTMRFYPPGVFDFDARVVVEVTEWEASTPKAQHEIILEAVDETFSAEANPNDRQWMLVVLELAAQVVENDMHLRDGGWVSGTCANTSGASETPSSKM